MPRVLITRNPTFEVSQQELEARVADALITYKHHGKEFFGPLDGVTVKVVNNPKKGSEIEILIMDVFKEHHDTDTLDNRATRDIVENLCQRVGEAAESVLAGESNRAIKVEILDAFGAWMNEQWRND